MHDFLIVKFQAYGFDNDFLNFLCNYFDRLKTDNQNKMIF